MRLITSDKRIACDGIQNTKGIQNKKPAAVRQREFKAVAQQKQKTQFQKTHCQNENKPRKCPGDTKPLQMQPAYT